MLPNDESHYLNKLFNEEIQAALDEINKNHNDCSCEEAAGRILKHFGIGLNTPLEKQLKSSTQLDKYPPNKIYRLALEFVESKEAAMQMAIAMGIYGEKYILGKISSGVFSFADLESNYQGFLFALNLCNSGSTRLKRSGKGWELSGSFDLRDYVNPFWDESYNPSYYYENQNLSLMPKSQAVLQNIPHYCLMFQSDRIQGVFDYYDSMAKPSYSVKYLQQLIDKGELPDPSPFYIRTICEE